MKPYWKAYICCKLICKAAVRPNRFICLKRNSNILKFKKITAQLDEGLITWVGNEALSKISSLTDADDVMTWIDIPKQADLPSDGDCVVLERVQDPGNAGTILRSAAAAGVKQIVCGMIPWISGRPKCCERGMGAHFLLSIFSRVELSAWIETYQHQNFGQPPWAGAILVYMKWTLVNLVTLGVWQRGQRRERNGKREGRCLCQNPNVGTNRILELSRMAATVCLF